MTSMEAIKAYFSDGSRPVENKELIELRRATPKEQWDDMGKACAKALGHEWTESK